MRIGIVANEPSGDQLGAGLMQAVRERIPDAHFEGVGGPLMNALGCHSLVPMEQLSVMGLVEVIQHLPRLLTIRRKLTQHFIAVPPNVFVGIDAPDFNLGLARRLRSVGIPTVHYVSPTVWAWRAGRVRTIRRSVDLILSLFPFEVPFLQQHQIPVCYVGHPLAEVIPTVPDRTAACAKLGLLTEQPVLALFPGSRNSEVQSLTAIFLKTAVWCQERYPQIQCVIPVVNPQLRLLIEKIWHTTAPQLSLKLVDGDSHTVLSAASLVLTASGTATLEAMLHQRPMVVAYKLHPLTYWLARTFNLVKVPYIALANILVGDELAPEFLQNACQPRLLGQALLQFIENSAQTGKIQERYRKTSQELRCDSRQLAAKAVLDIAERHTRNSTQRSLKHYHLPD